MQIILSSFGIGSSSKQSVDSQDNTLPNSQETKDFNEGKFWIVKDVTKYYLDPNDVKQYYIGSLALENIKVFDDQKKQYVQNTSVFSGFDQYARDRSFTGLVDYFTKVKEADFEKGHNWVQTVTPSIWSGHSYNKRSITGNVATLFANQDDKQGAQDFANNIITLFNKSREQIKTNYKDHNSLRLSRYLYNLSNLASIVPDVWMNFIKKHKEWLEKHTSYKDFYKQHIDVGNQIAQPEIIKRQNVKQNARDIPGAQILQTDVKTLNQQLQYQNRDNKDTGVQQQKIKVSNESQTDCNTATSQNKGLKLNLSDIPTDRQTSALLSRSMLPSKSNSLKSKSATYSMPAFFQEVIKQKQGNLVSSKKSQNQSSKLIEMPDKSITQTLQDTKVSNYDKYHVLKQEDSTGKIPQIFITKLEFKIADSEKHNGKMRISVGYEASNKAQVQGLIDALNKVGVGAEKADNPDYANCIYIKPSDLAKAWQTLSKKQGYEAYPANHDKTIEEFSKCGLKSECITSNISTVANRLH